MSRYDKKPPRDGPAEPDEEVQVEGALFQLLDAARKPVELALSESAVRAYLYTILFVVAALALLVLAAAAYIVFYFSYIPNRGFTLPIYLQFDPAHIHHPHGTVQLGPGHQLISAQPYDVHILLELPRTQNNQVAGNFMLDLRLLPAPPTSGAVGAAGAAIAEAVVGSDAAATLPKPLAHARRPAILTYYSPAVQLANNALRLPSYMLGWRREAERLRVDMLEGVVFARGWRNVPTSARLELHSDTKLQVYDAKVVFTAKLRGLRYLMYNYRVICFVVFTGVFWGVELLSAVIAWAALSQFALGRKGRGPKEMSPPLQQKRGEKAEGLTATDSEALAIKAEDEEAGTEGLSDTSRTFPTFSRQPPLRYSSPKEEPDTKKPTLAEVPPAGAEADDEDEDADFVLEEPPVPIRGIHSDSGLGTSMESSASRRDTVRRRKSGGLASPE